MTRTITKEKFKQQSHERLVKILTKLLNTTMIGAIAALEENMPEGDNVSSVELKDMFDIVRKAILDNGNKQKRAMLDEMSRYEVEWMRYHMDLPVRGA